MQLPRPINIDMLDFLRDGRFDCIEPGQTKEWILNNFPDPDGKCRIADDIWLYGNIEFHFGGGELVHIFPTISRMRNCMAGGTSRSNAACCRV